MIKISDEDRDVLREYIENVDELIDNDRVRDLLIEIFMLIEMKGLDEEYFFNDFGKNVQLIYNHVYDDNVEDDS